MLAAVEAALPADAAIFAAAVADWHVVGARGSKVKKDPSGRAAGARALREPRHPEDHRRRAAAGRPAWSSASPPRPTTSSPTPPPSALRKGADWIVANDVSPGTGIMGGTENAVTLITAAGAEPWPRMSKAGDRRGARRPHRAGAGMTVPVGIRRLAHRDPALPLPAYATDGAAGMDLCANLAARATAPPA